MKVKMKKLIIFFGLLLISSNISLAQADCSEIPPDNLSPLEAYSLFNDNYRNGDYEFALRFGRWIHCAKPEKLDGYPRFSLKLQYERLVRVYSEIAKVKEDPAVRTAYIDTAEILLDESLELFGNSDEALYDLRLRRGRFYQQNYSIIDDGLSKAYSEYEEMFKLNTEKAVKEGRGYYLRLVLTNMVNKNREKDAQNLIDQVKPLVEGELLDFVEEQQQKLLGSPEERIAYFEPVVQENPEDLSAWKALESAYEATGNREKLREVRVKIHELEPSYETAKNLAELAVSNANYSNAVKYFEEALKYTDDDNLRKQVYLNLADAYLNQGKLEQARAQARKAISIDANYGEAYMKIATIYGQAVSNCTSDRKLEASDKLVYYAVIDYLNKAKEVDSSVATSVNRQLPTYEGVTPTSEEKFLTLNVENGQKVEIDGSINPCYSWINETVTVR